MMLPQWLGKYSTWVSSCEPWFGWFLMVFDWLWFWERFGNSQDNESTSTSGGRRISNHKKVWLDDEWRWTSRLSQTMQQHAARNSAQALWRDFMGCVGHHGNIDEYSGARMDQIWHIDAYCSSGVSWCITTYYSEGVLSLQDTGNNCYEICSKNET